MNLDYADGHYYTSTLLGPKEAEEWIASGARVITMSEEVHERWMAHLARDGEWQNWFTLHANAAYERDRRERGEPPSDNECSLLAPNPLGPEYPPLGPHLVFE